ncbi:hypothetical protein [Fusobacterium varium]|uniref:hypothetical protein n=1 Tax=Fusobacterium varium TaxID=856 RepID=UPI00242AC524|nr:hypothetical protein [Fusobacterium varium]
MVTKHIKNYEEIEFFLFESLKYTKADLITLEDWEKEFLFERSKELKIDNLGYWFDSFYATYKKRKATYSNCKKVIDITERVTYKSLSELAATKKVSLNVVRKIVKENPDKYKIAA